MTAHLWHCHETCSAYLCPRCNPRRTLIAAVRDISAKRDMPLWVWDELLRPNNVVSLAFQRAVRAMSCG